MTEIQKAIAEMHRLATELYRKYEFVLRGVQAVVIEPRYTRQRVRKQHRTFWQYLFEDEYEWATVSDLPDLYLNGHLAGRLHSVGPETARVFQILVAARSGQTVDVRLTCHRTGAGFFIDLVQAC